MAIIDSNRLCANTPLQIDILNGFKPDANTNVGSYIADKLKGYSGIVNIIFKKPDGASIDDILPFSHNYTLTGFCLYSHQLPPKSITGLTYINLFGLYGVVGNTLIFNSSMLPKLTLFSITGANNWTITKATINGTIDSSVSYTNSSYNGSTGTFVLPDDTYIGIKNTSSLATTIDTTSIKNDILNLLNNDAILSELSNKLDLVNTTASDLETRMGDMTTTYSELEDSYNELNNSYVALNSSYIALNTFANDVSINLDNQKDAADIYVSDFDSFVKSYNDDKKEIENTFNASIKQWQEMIDNSDTTTRNTKQAAVDANNAAADARAAAAAAAKAALDACTAADTQTVRLDKLKAYVSLLDTSIKKLEQYQEAMSAGKDTSGGPTPMIG